MENLIAKAEVTIHADAEKIWYALTDPEKIKKYMFGASVETDWKTGSEITWKGEMKGKSYEDKGKILKVVPLKNLQYTHFSPMTGEEDQPENYHTITITIDDDGKKSEVILTQDNNKSEKEQQEFSKNWSSMLEGLKKVSEEK